MPLAPSALSRVCRSVADFVGSGLDASGSAVQVVLGTPNDAANNGGEPTHRLNLFFYRVEPAGFGATFPDEPWLVRLHCLITAFSLDEDGTSAGENDLRVLGEVLRLFHERPVLEPVAVNGRVVRLHAVLEALELDDLNHLWSTQTDVSLRPSIAYELSLAPIPPRQPRVVGPSVGAIGLAAHPDADPDAPRAAPSARPPTVGRFTVEVRRADWPPRICFVEGGESFATVTLVAGSEAAAFEPGVWIAGAPGAPVTLQWETWSSDAGWVAGPTTDAEATTTTLDPALAAEAETTAVELPFDDRPGQAALYAIRTWTRADGTDIEIRSNPLLVTLVEAGP